MHYQNFHRLLICLLLFCSGGGCENKRTPVQTKIPVPVVTAKDGIDKHIRFLLQENENIPFINALVHFYTSMDYKPVWSNMQKENMMAVSMQGYLDTAYRDGLYKTDYMADTLTAIRGSLSLDSTNKNDNRLWAKADIFYTSALLHILQDLRQGRLQPDSLQLKNDTSSYSRFFEPLIHKCIEQQDVSDVLNDVQVKHPGYIKLKEGIRRFSDSMDKKFYTYIFYPYKRNQADSVSFIKRLQERLSESGVADKKIILPDSLMLSGTIKKYQAIKKITTDGKISISLINALNNTDVEKFKRIAITLDRYKLLPATMPENYIWVNLPAYKLEVWNNDSVVLNSRIICGKPGTPTPLLTSAISDLVIYPTWTVPESIIAKEMLPGLKKNTGYLAKKGLNLINNKGEMIDPATISWAKYSKGIPYKIQQGSGDGNALGVIKFNFANPYSVYLHDTNQRYLFKNAKRALSHGCVRVQEWEKLAFYILKNDSTHSSYPDSSRYNIDTIKTWITNKERHRINVRYQFPLFIRYFGCEGINGTIKFYEDIYGADKMLGERFFSQKKI